MKNLTRTIATLGTLFFIVTCISVCTDDVQECPPSNPVTDPHVADPSYDERVDRGFAAIDRYLEETKETK